MDRIVRVTGRGRITVRPDTIQLNISTEGICREYGEAVSESAQQTGIVRTTIEKAGLDPKGLMTVHFGVDTDMKATRINRAAGSRNLSVINTVIPCMSDLKMIIPCWERCFSS